jgi:hypothetical protein
MLVERALRLAPTPTGQGFLVLSFKKEPLAFAPIVAIMPA